MERMLFLNKRLNIGQWGREIVEDPGKNYQRLCEVGTGYSPSYGVKKKKNVKVVLLTL